jgi:arylformamidase
MAIDDGPALDGDLERLTRAMAGATVLDLTHTLEEGIPGFPTHPKYFQMPWHCPGDAIEVNQLVIAEHSGTHVDSPSHFVVDEADPARLHIDEMPLETMIGRALTLHVGPFEATNALVTHRDVVRWESENVAIESGDIILMDFGWAHRWATMPEGQDFIDGWPGLDREASEYMAERGVKAVGTDCISLDPGDNGKDGDLAAHYTLLPQGILIIENLANLPAVPAVSNFVALPLKIKNGTGSPIRAMTFVSD